MRVVAGRKKGASDAHVNERGTGVSSLFVAGSNQRPMAKGEQINLDNAVSGSDGSDGQLCWVGPVTNTTYH